MANQFSRKMKIPFSEASDKIKVALRGEGFCVLSSIDVQHTLKKKLNLDFRNYQIINAFIPELAYKAITHESHAGLFLNCQILLQEHENSEVEISALDPMTILEQNGPTELIMIFQTLSNKLRTAIDELHYVITDVHQTDPMPALRFRKNTISPIHG